MCIQLQKIPADALMGFNLLYACVDCPTAVENDWGCKYQNEVVVNPPQQSSLETVILLLLVLVFFPPVDPVCQICKQNNNSYH